MTNRESGFHSYAKTALVNILNKIYEGYNCFHAIEYPLLKDSSIWESFDEHYHVRKKDSAIVSLKGDDYDDLKSDDYPYNKNGKYEWIRRVNHCQKSMSGYHVDEEKCIFSNMHMPSPKNYKDGGLIVKYFVDVVQVWKGSLNCCYEIKYKNPTCESKINYIKENADDYAVMYEIPAKFILSFDVTNPNLDKFRKECDKNYLLFGEDSPYKL